MKYFVLILVAFASAVFISTGLTKKKDVQRQIDRNKNFRSGVATSATIAAIPPTQFVGAHPQIFREFESFYNKGKTYFDDFITFLPKNIN